MTLIIGDHAPDFELTNQYGESVKLSDFRGKKPVVLVFYPLSFSGICTGELCEIRDNFAKFEAHVDGKVRDAAPGIRLAAE